MKLLFAKTRYSYASYQDLWRLVDLAKFPWCWVDEIDYDKEIVYVLGTINGEFRPTIAREREKNKTKRCKVVWWNLERVDSGPGGLNDLIGTMVCNNTRDMLELVDKVWVSDRYMANLDSRLQFLPMGSHPGLAMGERRPGNFDFCHMSYINERRVPILSVLARLKIGPNCWDPDRSFVINTSRLILNIHQTEAPIAEPLRFALAAAYGIPLVTETLADPYPLEPGKNCLMARYPDLPKTVLDALEHDPEPIGIGLRDLLIKAFPFRACVEAAFEELIR